MRGRHRWLVCCIALAAVAACAVARAQDEGRFEIRNAYVELSNEIWQLDVRLDLALAEAAQQAFEEGVPLVLALEIEASVDRRFLPDETVVSLTRRWQLAYYAISQRYVVTNAKSGEHMSHASQADAFEALARLGGIEIADTAKLPPDARFDMRVRASVDIGDLPAAVKLLLFWKSWSRSTDWYAWKVRP